MSGSDRGNTDDDSGRPTVFISYAHESDALQSAVLDLARWLENHGCTVWTDHEFKDRPPPRGWQVWMHECVTEASVVLIVCTPKMKAGYQKKSPPGEGRGRVFEGAIITQSLYDALMHNQKFYPVLPRDGDEAHIPETLRPWSNGHRFPGGEARILAMIRNESPSTSASGRGQESAPPPRRSTELQARVAESSLRGSMELLSLLERELSDAGQEIQGAAPVVRWLLELTPADVESALYLIRRALMDVPPAPSSARTAAEKAAAALYYLAACRLVNRELRQSDGSFLVEVESSERLFCAVVATALFGGELRLIPGEEPGQPQPECVFSVVLPESGECTLESFERAVFESLDPIDREATRVTLDAVPLGDEQRALLLARVKTIKNVQRRAFALVILGSLDRAAAGDFAGLHGIPVLIPTTPVTTALLGMRAVDLTANLREFWRELTSLSRGVERSTATGDPPKSVAADRSIRVDVSGPNANISITGGDESPAQAGSGHLGVVRNEGLDLPKLLEVLAELEGLIRRQPRDARESLEPHLRNARDEAEKEKPSASALQKATNNIKRAAEALTDGQKIVEVCARLYGFLGPFL